MEKDNLELIATLNAIAEVAERLSVKNNNYKQVAKVSKRIAQLESEGFSEETILVLLHVEGFITDNELDELLEL